MRLEPPDPKTTWLLLCLVGCAQSASGGGGMPSGMGGDLGGGAGGSGAGGSGSSGRGGTGAGGSPAIDPSGGSGGSAGAQTDGSAPVDARPDGAVLSMDARGDTGGGVPADAPVSTGPLPSFCGSYPPARADGQWQSMHVSYDGAGKLSYKSDAEKNRIPDFSRVGYHYGAAPIPNVPEVSRLEPAAGDNTARIQAALDAIGERPADGNGIRGALLLAPGRYEIAGTVRVNKGGVVLRGSGDGEDPARDTILFATGDVPHQRTVVVAGSGMGGWTEGTPRTNITTPFVPVSGMSFEVESAAGLGVGDNIIVHHPSTQAWIDAVEGGGTGKDPPWSPGSMEILYNRKIAAITGNTVTLDAPVYYHLNRALSQAYIAKAALKHITEVGVENLRVDVQTAAPDDENHAWNGIALVGAHDSWVRGITAVHWGYAGISVQWSVRITIDSSRANDPVAIRTGGRMYNIAMDHGAELVLVKNCEVANGRHSYVSNGNSSASGIVFYRSKMTRGDDVEAGHKRWTQGVLYDNVVELVSDGTYILLGNRGDWGTQHGWAAVHSVIWNFNKQMIVQKPPTAQNYAISIAGTKRGPIFPGPEGSIEINGPNLVPGSLYEAQLCERLRR